MLCFVAAVVVYKLVEWYLTCPERYGRHSFKKGAYGEDSYSRRRLDRIRARDGHFPPPFPNGWYRVADSKEVKKGELMTISALDKEIIVFRGQDGKIGVVDAFCPHLGTHLGHGGMVVGNNIQCPYHLWEFDCNGINKKIPYCKKDMSGSKRVNVKSYYHYESDSLGQIFLWYHSDDTEPEWELHPGLQDIENEIKRDTMVRKCQNRWPDMLMHIFEPSQNSGDYFHFLTVHQWLPMPFNLKLVKADHTINSVYGKEGSDLPKQCILIRERLDRLRIFGWDILTLPSIITNNIVTYVHIQGPQNVIFKVDTIFGRFRAHYAMIPTEPFRQKATMVMYSDETVPWFVARLLHWWIQETAAQDLQVWEHKTHVKPRQLVAGDGPFAQYGAWLNQFYTKTSFSWKDHLTKESMDW